MKNFYKNYKKTCIMLITLISLAIFYTLFGFFGVPWMLKSVVPSFLTDKNTTLTIKEVKFNPYKFELNATGVDLKTYTDLFGAQQIDVGLKFREIFSKNISFKIVRLVEPYVNVQREGNLSFNFDPLIMSDEPKKSEKNDDDKSFFNLTLDKIELIRGDVRYADNSLKHPFDATLKDLSYEIRDINLKEYSVGKHLLDTNSNILDEFDLKGGVSLNPLRIYGNIKLGGLRLEKIWQSYMSDMDLNVTKGKLDTMLKYNISIDENGVGVSIDNSKISAQNFVATDKNSTIKFDTLSFDEINLDSIFSGKNELKFDVKNIGLNGLARDEILLKNVNINGIKLELLSDESLKLDGEISSIKVQNIEQNASIVALLEIATLNSLKYSLNDTFTMQLGELNATNFNLTDSTNFTNFSNFDLNNINTSYEFKSGDFALTLPVLNLSKLGFKNADISVENDNFYLNDFNISAQNNFANIAVNGAKFGVNSHKLQGFDIDITSQNFNFTDLNVSLKTEQNATSIVANLANIKSKPVAINAKNEKFVMIDSVSADELKFDGNNTQLAKFSLAKTDIFSNKKNFAGFNELSLNDINFELSTMSLGIKDVKVGSLFYNDEVSKAGAKAINELAILKQSSKKNSQAKAMKTAGKSKHSDVNFIANIENIELINANSKITYNFTGAPLTHNIALKTAKISNFSSDFSKPFGLNLSLKTSDKISLSAKGKILLEPLNAQFDSKFEASELASFNNVLSHYLNAKITSGKISANSKIKLDKNYKIDTNFILTNFALNDTNNTKVASINAFNVKKIALNYKGISIDDVTLSEPFVKMHIYKDKSINLAKLLKDDKKDETKTKQTTQQTNTNEFKTEIKNINVQNASVDFSDDSLVLPFVFGIKNLNAQVDKIQNADVATISSQGTIGTSASASIKARLDVFSPKKFSDIVLKFKDVELNEITPYSATFVGRKIDSGRLNLSLAYLINNNKMDGKNNIVIDTIKLGESVKSPSAINLPLQLAISILQDSNNVIDLNLPVSGDLENPQFSYGGIVWQAITQLFTDVVTSPFRLLGNVLGVSNANELSAIDFSVGSDELMDSQSKKINEFKAISQKKSDVVFVINPAYDEVVDKLAVQKRLLERDIAMQANARGVTQLEIISEMAQRKFKSQPADAYDKLIKARKISDSALDELAFERAQNLYEAMITAGVPSHQLKISNKVQKTKAKVEFYVPLPIGIESKK